MITELPYDRTTVSRLKALKADLIIIGAEAGASLTDLARLSPTARIVAITDGEDRTVSPLQLIRDGAHALIEKPVTVGARDDQEVVANKIAKYNLLAVPVLEEDGSAVGFVTVDDVVDVMIEEGTEDVLRMAAVEPGGLDKPYFDSPLSSVVRRRVVWLLLLFVAGTLSGTVLRHFEAELSSMVALSFFIPLLIGTGGNAGSQTVMTVIRSLALSEIRFRDARRVVARELGAGLSLGLLVASVALGHALATGATAKLALTVAATMLAICAWATTVGSLVPLLAQRVGLDPAVLSAPMIATLVDATGLVIYFTIARWVLGL